MSNGIPASIELLVGNKFEQIWLLDLDVPLSKKEKEFQWKIIHNAVYTEHKLLLMNMSEDGFCHFCKSNLETLAHLFFYCRRTNRVIYEIENKINRALEDDSRPAIKIAPYHFIPGFNHENRIIRVFVNLIIMLAKFEIWKIRNKIKIDNIQVTNCYIFEHTMQKILSAIRFLENTNIACKYEKELSFWKKIN